MRWLKRARRVGAQLASRLQAEHGGANILVIVGMSFGLLLVTPFFFNAASEYMTRRSAQNGADAASLAGAEWFAERLTFSPGKPGHYAYYRIPDQECLLDITPDPVLASHSIALYQLQQYDPVVAMLGLGSQAGLPEAERLASENHTQVLVDRYLPDLCHGTCENSGTFLALAVSSIERRTIVTAEPSYFGDNGLPIRARATATTFLDSLNVVPTREICPAHVPPFVVIGGQVHYFVRLPLDVVWLIHLKEYQGLPYPN